ncbi:SpoIIIAH-like family protein [Bacillota bacterium LX-D]|nr:SpoIIIAH-like family protein [Bacillota bacterium LX-D]
MTIFTNKKLLSSFLLILLAMVVLIGYHGSKNKSVNTINGQNSIVNEEKNSVNTKTKLNSESDTSIKKSNEDFFVEYRLERDKNRSRQIELLMHTIVNNPNSGQKERAEAQKKILDLTSMSEQEIKLENLLKAKGYNEAALFIQSKSVIVIVQGANFTDSDALKISDLVNRTIGYPFEQITIIPKV